MRGRGISNEGSRPAASGHETWSGVLIPLACVLLGVGLGVQCGKTAAPQPETASLPSTPSLPAATPSAAPPAATKPALLPPSVTSRATAATFRGDAGLTGVFAGPAPEMPVGIRWRATTGGTPTGGLVWDGNSFFVALAEGTVIAFDAQGRERWRRGAALDGIAGPPLVIRNRCVVVSPSGTFAAFDTTSGELVWRFTAPVDIAPRHAPSPVSDNLVSISQSDGRLLALDSFSGRLRWISNPGARCDGPLSAADNQLFFGNCNAALQIHSADDGAEIASLPLGPGAEVAGAVAVQGSQACFGTRSGDVILLERSSNTIRWRTRVAEAEVFSSPALTADLAVITTAEAQVVALATADGTIRWRYDTHQRSATSAILVEGYVIIGASGIMYALDAKTGSLLWHLAVGDATTEPVTGAGLIVVGTDEGDIVAIGSRRP